MKYLLYFLFPILSFSSLAQLQSSCTGTALLTQTYDRDIANLALKRLYDTHSPDTDLISIPQQYLDTITNGLYAIYNLGAAVEADSVFRIRCIHVSPVRETTRDIMVFVDPSYPWTAAWKNKQVITGYTALDSLMSLYGYSIADYYSGSFDIALLHTDKLINTIKFAEVLKNYQGISDAQISNGIGDGDIITYSRDTVGYFNFYMGWGDCPAGCTSHKVWKYKVDDNCKVTFLGTQLTVYDPWPAPLNCNLYKVEVEPITVNPHPEMWPNPVTSELHFSNYTDYSYNLFDMRKRRIAGANAIQESHTLDVSGLASGVYLLQMRSPTGNSFVRKIIKL